MIMSEIPHFHLFLRFLGVERARTIRELGPDCALSLFVHGSRGFPSGSRCSCIEAGISFGPKYVARFSYLLFVSPFWCCPWLGSPFR